MVVSQILMYGEDDHFLDQPVWTQDIWIKETRPGWLMDIDKGPTQEVRC